MSLDKLTKIDGGGISTTSDYRVGVITATKFVGPVEGSITATDASFSGNVSIAGTLTYEDVTNVDSVGIITAKQGIHIDDSIVHIGDTDTKIRFPGSDIFTIETGGSERVRVDSAGLKILDKLLHFGDIDTAIRFPAADTITAETGGSERLRITSGGSLGIGTATIRNNRTVQITGASQSNLLITGNAPSICLNADADDSTDNDRSFLGQAIGSNNFANGTAAGDTVLRGKSSGRIIFGIGTNIKMNLTSAGDLNIGSVGRFDASGLVKTAHGTESTPSHTFLNDPDNGMYRPTTNTLGFVTGGTERLRITNSGLVGIGTITPNAVLHVEKNGTNQVLARFESNMGTNNNRALSLTSPTSDSASLPFTFSTGNSIEFKCDSHVVHIDDNGKLGIGTNDPQGQLHITSGNSGDCRVYIEADEDNNNEGDNPFIIFKNDGGVENASVWCGNADGTNDNSLNLSAATNAGGGIRFFTSSTAGGWETASERLRIASDGKVGINETSPDRILHVRSDGVAAAKLGGESGGAYYMEIGQLASSGSPGFNATGSSASMLFQLNGSEKLRIKSNGNVGINQNNPSTTLDVNGNIKLTGQLFQSTPADFWSQGNTFIELNGVGNLTHMGSYETCLTSNGYRDNNTQWKSYGINGNTGAAQIRLNPAGSIIMGAEASKSDGSSHNVIERLRISAAGNVGIASAGPTTRLDVFGTGTTLAQFGDSRSTSFECIRIKNNIASYPAISNDSSSDTLDLRSMGSVQATIDANNNSTGKYFRVVHNGEGNSGTELFKVSDNGVVYMPRGVISLTKQGSSNYVEIGAGQNANNYAYVDMIGDSTYTDYGLRLIRGNTGANASSQLIHRGTGTFSIQTTEAAQIDFRTSGNNNRLSIEAGGNVGINTNNPDHRFHVYHPTTNTVAKFESGDAGCGMLFKDLTATTRIEQYNTEFKIDHDTEGQLAESSRHINLDLNGATKLSVHHEGVRIGSSVTGTPNQRLHVDGNIYLGPNNTSRIIHSGAALAFSADSNMYFTVDSNDTSGTAPGGEFVWGGGSETNTDSNGDFTEAEFGNGFRPRNQYMYLNETTLRPTSSGGLTLGQSSYRWGTIYTNTSLNTSDRNEKKEIIDCDLGLDFICKLNPVSYKWNTERNKKADTKVHYGLIAQDVEEVILSEGKTLDDFGAVDKSDEEAAAMGLSYNEFIAPMIKALQEANEKIKILETEVAALKSL